MVAIIGVLVAPDRVPASAATGTISFAADGTVRAPRTLALDFAAPGRLVEIAIAPGEHVAAGQLLARTDPAAALAGVQTARATLASARAQLVQLRAGLSAAERRQLAVTLQQSTQALDAARQTLGDARASVAADTDRLRTSVTQAQAQLQNDRAAFTADQRALASDQAALATDTATAQAATTTVASDRAALAADQGSLLEAQKKQLDDQAGTPSPTLVAGDAKAILDAQAATGTDQSTLASDETAAGDARAAAEADRSRIEAAEQTVAADRSHAVADANELAVAYTGQAAGAAADDQSLHAARSSFDAARLTVAATRAQNAVRLQRPSAGALASARAAVLVAEASVATTEDALGATRLVAPFAGTIAAVNGVEGQLAPAQGPGGLITLVDLRRLAVSAQFPAAEAALIPSGAHATVTVPDLGRQLDGTVEAVDPEPSGTAYGVTITVAGSPGELLPGMHVETSVTFAAALR